MKNLLRPFSILVLTIQKQVKILTLDELIKIQYTAGNELDTVFILHESIKKLIRGNNHVH